MASLARRIDPSELSADRHETKWVKPFHFVQAADCQFGLTDRYVKKLPEPGWSEEIDKSERFVAACNRMQPKPEFVVVCGDLTDSWPAGPIRDQQVQTFKKIFNQLDPDIKLMCVCGNHDAGDKPTLEAVNQYKLDFDTNDYYYFVKAGVLFIVINSQFYEHRAYLEDYARQQDNWLLAMLDKCKLFRHSFIFEHIPWFLNEPNESDEYFNIRNDVREFWLARFEQAGVSKIMCGHYHRNAGGWFGGATGNKVELVVTGPIGAPLGDDPSGARVVEVSANNIEHNYYALDRLPSRVELVET